MPQLAATRWWIYKITNPSGRIYIGKTSNLKRRLSQYEFPSGGGRNQQPLLYNSLIKYGYRSHTVDLLETFVSDDTWANGKEMFWIRSFMTNLNRWRDANGMNLSDGGEGNRGHKWTEERKKIFSEKMKGRKISEEQKSRLSEYNKKFPTKGMLGKKNSPEARQKMSAAKKGMISTMKGKTQRPESIFRMSKSKLGKKIKRVAKAKRRVKINTSRQPVMLMQNGTTTEFYSKRATARYLGIGAGLVSSLLNGLNNGCINDCSIKLKSKI